MKKKAQRLDDTVLPPYPYGAAVFDPDEIVPSSSCTLLGGSAFPVLLKKTFERADKHCPICSSDEDSNRILLQPKYFSDNKVLWVCSRRDCMFPLLYPPKKSGSVISVSDYIDDFPNSFEYNMYKRFAPTGTVGDISEAQCERALAGLCTAMSINLDNIREDVSSNRPDPLSVNEAARFAPFVSRLSVPSAMEVVSGPKLLRPPIDSIQPVPEPEPADSVEHFSCSLQSNPFSVEHLGGISQSESDEDFPCRSRSFSREKSVELQRTATAVFNNVNCDQPDINFRPSTSLSCRISSVLDCFLHCLCPVSKKMDELNALGQKQKRASKSKGGKNALAQAPSSFMDDAVEAALGTLDPSISDLLCREYTSVYNCTSCGFSESCRSVKRYLYLITDSPSFLRNRAKNLIVIENDLKCNQCNNATLRRKVQWGQSSANRFSLLIFLRELSSLNIEPTDSFQLSERSVAVVLKPEKHHKKSRVTVVNVFRRAAETWCEQLWMKTGADTDKGKLVVQPGKLSLKDTVKDISSVRFLLLESVSSDADLIHAYDNAASTIEQSSSAVQDVVKAVRKLKRPRSRRLDAVCRSVMKQSEEAVDVLRSGSPESASPTSSSNPATLSSAIMRKLDMVLDNSEYDKRFDDTVRSALMSADTMKTVNKSVDTVLQRFQNAKRMKLATEEYNMRNQSAVDANTNVHLTRQHSDSRLNLLTSFNSSINTVFPSMSSNKDPSARIAPASSVQHGIQSSQEKTSPPLGQPITVRGRVLPKLPQFDKVYARSRTLLGKVKTTGTYEAPQPGQSQSRRGISGFATPSGGHQRRFDSANTHFSGYCQDNSSGLVSPVVDVVQVEEEGAPNQPSTKQNSDTDMAKLLFDKIQEVHEMQHTAFAVQPTHSIAEDAFGSSMIPTGSETIETEPQPDAFDYEAQFDPNDMGHVVSGALQNLIQVEPGMDDNAPMLLETGFDFGGYF